MERIFTRLKHLCRRYLILIFEDCHQSWKDITITIIVPSEKSRYVFLYLISGEEKKTRRTCHRIRHPPTNGQYVVTTPTPKNTLTNFIEGGRKSRPLSTPPIVTQITDESRIILQEISLERVKKLTGALSGASNRVARSEGGDGEREKERKEGKRNTIKGVHRSNPTRDGCGGTGWLHARRLSLSLARCVLPRRGSRVIKEFRRGRVLSGYPRRDSGGNGVGKTGWSPRGSTARNACTDERKNKKGGGGGGRRRRRRSGGRRRRTNGGGGRRRRRRRRIRQGGRLLEPIYLYEHHSHTPTRSNPCLHVCTPRSMYALAFLPRRFLMLLCPPRTSYRGSRVVSLELYVYAG